MKPPFVSRRTHEAVLADRERIRSERDQFAKDCKAQHAAARTAARQFTGADEELAATRIVNGHLTEELTDARQKLAASMDAEAALAKQIHTLAQPVEPTDAYLDEMNALIRERDAEKRRADGFEKRYYDAVGLPPDRIEDSRPWQPAYTKPTVDKPAIEETTA